MPLLLGSVLACSHAPPPGALNAPSDNTAVARASTDAGPTQPPAAPAKVVGPNGRAETPAGFRHIYSQIQAWSSDGMYFLTVNVQTGEAVVFHAGTWEAQARLFRAGHRWVTGTHQVLMFDDQPDTGAALFTYDLDTGVETERLRLGHPGLRAGRSQEEMDRAGRWVAVYIDQPRTGQPRIITANLAQGRVAADVAIDEIGCDFEPDWVGVDPTGTYLLVQSVKAGRGTCAGLWVHDIESGRPIHQLTEHGHHGSTGIGPKGRPYFLSTSLAHPKDNGSPGIVRYWIDTAKSEVVGPPLPWGALDHVSCLGGPGAPCIVSGGNKFESAFNGQVWWLNFDGKRTVIEPHHAIGCDYWGQAQATVGPNGQYAFATHGGDCDAIRSVVMP